MQATQLLFADCQKLNEKTDKSVTKLTVLIALPKVPKFSSNGQTAT
jgi:hypothetical protein